MKIIERIVMRRRRKQFKKRCLMIPCTQCPEYIKESCKCMVAIECGLEEAE